MRKKSRITNVLGLGSLPLIAPTIKEPKYETPRQLSQRLRREEAEEIAKKQRAVEAADPTRQAERAYVDAMTELAIKTRDRLRKLYRDVPTIEDYIRHDIEALTDDIGLPQGSPVTMKEFETRIKAFVEGLPKGVIFDSDVSKRKFELYTWVAARHGTVIDNSTLQAMLERCESLGIGVTLPRTVKATVKPEPTATERLSELLQTTSGESRQGKRLLETAVEDAALVDIARPLFAEYLSHLYSLGGFKPSEDDKRYILKFWIPRNNLSYTQAETYNRATRHMVSIHRWPDSLLPIDQRLAREVEDVDLNDYSQRRDFARRIREQQQIR
jgi:hypothetical protein